MFTENFLSIIMHICKNISTCNEKEICIFIKLVIKKMKKKPLIITKKGCVKEMYKAEILGNLTADPILNEREYTDKETGEIIKTKVCNFTVAADDGFGARKQTQFFRVNAWRGLGETCAKYLKKGRGVFVSGPINLNNYVDKNKNLHAVMEIRADQIQFLNDGKGIETPETLPEDYIPENPY